MPVNVVKTAADERHWHKAKAAAKKQGRAKDWKYVMGIFQKMKGESLAKRFVNALLEDEVEEMTTTAAIATVPMGFASDSEMPTTPRDSEIVANPVDLGPGRKK